MLSYTCIPTDIQGGARGVETDVHDAAQDRSCAPPVAAAVPRPGAPAGREDGACRGRAETSLVLSDVYNNMPHHTVLCCDVLE